MATERSERHQRLKLDRHHVVQRHGSGLQQPTCNPVLLETHGAWSPVSSCYQRLSRTVPNTHERDKDARISAALFTVTAHERGCPKDDSTTD
jgi:hypothetical protein